MAGTGLLFAYILGAILRYDMCVWVYMVLPIASLLGSAFLHESPYYLIKKNKLRVKLSPRRTLLDLTSFPFTRRQPRSR